MTASAPHQGQCQIIGGNKLPASVGPNAICVEVARAMTRLAPAARYNISVQVLSSTRLSAALVVNGRALPAQNFAVMDRELNPGSIRRFAESLAGEAAKAAKE